MPDVCSERSVITSKVGSGHCATCKWNQLVYFAIITANKPNQPPDFHCISPVRFGNKAQNAKFSATEQHQKLHISMVNF